jgi:hypothetical protein
VQLEGLRKLEKKKLIHLIGSGTRDLPSSNIVPQPLCYLVLPMLTHSISNIRPQQVEDTVTSAHVTYLPEEGKSYFWTVW